MSGVIEAGCDEILSGPERRELRGFWLVISIDPETRQLNRGSYANRGRTLTTFSLNLALRDNTRKLIKLRETNGALQLMRPKCGLESDV